MAYLLQQQRADPVPPEPKEWEDLVWGMAEILRRLSSRVDRVSRELEQETKPEVKG